MIGGDERAISGTAAAEHGQGEHALISNGRGLVSQIGNQFCRAGIPDEVGFVSLRPRRDANDIVANPDLDVVAARPDELR